PLRGPGRRAGRVRVARSRARALWRRHRRRACRRGRDGGLAQETVMLPTLEGIIARRVLVNFRVDPDVARRLVPAPLEPIVERGACVAGICLIRLERLRPKGLPAVVGLASENMAHRIAIRYPTPAGASDGVFIWRRDTDQGVVNLLRRRLLSGGHWPAALRAAAAAG